MKPASIQQVRIHDTFFDPIRQTVTGVMLPYQWQALNDAIPDAPPSHAIDNLRIAAGLKEGKSQGFVFQDSDLAKWIEAASYALMQQPDAKLEADIDSVIDLFEKMQQPDGYLNSYYTTHTDEKRWSDLRDGHEMYCAGHLLEGAVAYAQATGKTRFLDIMCRYIDLIDSTFGPEEHKSKGYCGHQEIELALVKLYQFTGTKRYLNLAQYFIDQRGQSPIYFEAEHADEAPRWPWQRSGMKCYQAHKPIRDQHDMEGHAVRAMYQCTAIADLARENNDDEMKTVARRLWASTTHRRMYIHGGIGSNSSIEGFSSDYDLINDRMYAETCAAIGLVFFANRMLQIDPSSEYADVMERSLYNNVLSGMGEDGKHFFYPNPLEVVPQNVHQHLHCLSHIALERRPWFGCACCPPNIARLMVSLPQYIYGVDEDTVYTHLFIGSTLTHERANLSMTSTYPLDGKVDITFNENTDITLALRIPGWCEHYEILKNGKTIHAPVENGYARISGSFTKGDTVSLRLDIKPRRVWAHVDVDSDAGKVAIMRGPLVYCLEEADNGKKLHQLFLPRKVTLTDVDGGIKAEGLRITQTCNTLYHNTPPSMVPATMSFIPYYKWNNRGQGEMRVWVHDLP